MEGEAKGQVATGLGPESGFFACPSRSPTCGADVNSASESLPDPLRAPGHECEAKNAGEALSEGNQGNLAIFSRLSLGLAWDPAGVLA